MSETEGINYAKFAWEVGTETIKVGGTAVALGFGVVFLPEIVLVLGPEAVEAYFKNLTQVLQFAY